MEELVCSNLGNIHKCILILNQIDEEIELHNKIPLSLQICDIIKNLNRGKNSKLPK